MRSHAKVLFAVAALFSFLALAPTASAVSKKVDRFFPLTTGTGTEGAKFNTPRGIAVNDPAVADANGTEGWIYVADDANHRIQAFNAAGAFQWAIGRDVITGGATDVLEKCTVAAECKIGSFGLSTDGPTGEFDNPQGIAIDQSNGHLFVRDRDNRRVQEFEADGDFVRMWGWDVVNGVTFPAAPNNNGTSFEVCDVTAGNVGAECKIGTAGAAAGQIGSSTQVGTGIAVNPLNGDVFLADPQNRRVMQFDPQAAPAIGTFVRAFGWGVDSGANTRFEICTTASTCSGGVNNPVGGGLPNGHFGSNKPSHIAVDSRGIVYADDNPPGAARLLRFDSTVAGDDDVAADLLLKPAFDTGITASALDVDPDSDGAGSADFDRLYVGTSPFASATGIREFNVSANEPPTTSNLVETHMLDSGLGQLGIAHNASQNGGELYVTSNSGSPAAHRVYVLDNDGASGALDVVLNPPTGVGAHTASFSGTVNPAGFPVKYRFEYSKTGIDGSWVAVAPDADLGSGTSPVAVPLTPSEGQVSTLEANTLYRVRIVGTRGFGNGAVFSPELAFVTDAAKPDATTLATPGASDTAVNLMGEVNPNGSPTTYRFEYGPTAAYGTKVPVPDAAIGSAGTPQAVSQQLSGLAPGATYHYRVVATNAQGTTNGADMTFTTLAAVADPPARAYELVSPADKPTGPGPGSNTNNTGLEGVQGVYGGFAASTGERYISTAVKGALLTEGGAAAVSDNALAERTATGWVNKAGLNRRDYGSSPVNSFFSAAAANEDLSLLMFLSQIQGNKALIFPEMVPLWPGTDDSGFAGRYIRDWEGKWRLVDPTDPSQPNEFFELRGNRSGFAISEDGTHAAYSTKAKGSLGPTDPSLDQTTGELAAAIDVSGGISDTWEDRGPTSLLGVCTGSGAERTLLPSVDAGQVTTRTCPAPSLSPARDETLIDVRGSATRVHNGAPKSLQNLISDDNRRIFFMSPDPEVDASDNPCTGTLDATACPPQLYVRQTESDGSFRTRWVSQPETLGQPSGLLGPAYFEGASSFGDKVFFSTNSKLSADDPNAGNATAASNTSWDVYSYELPSDSEGKANGSDPEDGTLTRISAGPTGTAECNANSGGSDGREVSPLRFLSEDGTRAYFTCANPLAGVPAPSNGTITTPGSAAGQTNLYHYDSTKPLAERWEFVARLPRGTGFVNPAACATVHADDAPPLRQLAYFLTLGAQASCVRGAKDGLLVTFSTPGQLTADDPDTAALDIYAFDAGADRLSRITAPQGGVGGTYTCLDDPGFGGLHALCHGDGGIGQSNATFDGFNKAQGAATDPATGEHIAYFQSRSRLVPSDTDNWYDVYEWRAGKLSIVSEGIEDTHAFYSGNGDSGRDVFMTTDKRLTWEDIDGVRDVYDARVGGGFAQPIPPPSCDVLGGLCQGEAQAPATIPAPSSSSSSSGGNVVEKQATKKKKAKKKKQRAKQKRKAAKRRAQANRRAGK